LNKKLKSIYIKNIFIINNLNMKKEYKVWIYQEWLLWSVLLWQSKVDPIKFTEFLNIHWDEWWRVVTIEREKRRALLFFAREAMVVVFEREKNI